MTPKYLVIFSIFFLVFGMTTTAFAHSTKIVGDFKIETGWKNEPPIEEIPNAVELTISLAEEADKQTYDMVFFNRLDNINEKPTKKDLSGLDDKIEASVTLEGKKILLVLKEDEENKGVYYAYITPKAGKYTLHLYGIIKNLEFETTGQIETVKPNTDTNEKLPNWIRNNAKWYAEGSIGESDFISGIQYMIANNIIDLPKVENTSSQKLSSVPEWIKNNAKWWSEGQISDDDFIKGIQFLVKNRIIQI
jgi:hypothetical protein